MYADNVVGEEADAVMLNLVSRCESEEDVVKLHKVIGHRIFSATMLSGDEVREVEKVHRYFGHKSGRKVYEMFAKAGKFKDKKKAILELLDNCSICRKMKKTPPRPRIGMPVANSFNEIVGLDLKVLGHGKYILWIIDMFTKLAKGMKKMTKR